MRYIVASETVYLPSSANVGTICFGGRTQNRGSYSRETTLSRCASLIRLCGTRFGTRRRSSAPLAKRCNVRACKPSSRQASLCRAPVSTASLIRSRTRRRSSTRWRRPRPPTERPLFSEHQQRRRLRQSLLLASKLALELFDSLRLRRARLRLAGAPQRLERCRLDRLLPLAELLFMQPLAPQEFAQLGPGQAARLHDRGQLFLCTPIHRTPIGRLPWLRKARKARKGAGSKRH